MKLTDRGSPVSGCGTTSVRPTKDAKSEYSFAVRVASAIKADLRPSFAPHFLYTSGLYGTVASLGRTNASRSGHSMAGSSIIKILSLCVSLKNGVTVVPGQLCRAARERNLRKSFASLQSEFAPW